MYIILALPVFYWLYWTYLIYILDAIAHCCALIKIRKDVLTYNLHLVLPEAKNHAEIGFKSLKLAYLNGFIAFHQPFLVFRDSLLKRYIFDIPEELKSDLRMNKAVFVLAHYGIFYDFISAHQLMNSPIASVYKMQSKWLEKWIFQGAVLKGKIFGVKHDRLNQHLNHPYGIMSLPCDQKGGRLPGTFLNQPTLIHSSPADIHKITKRALWAYLCKYDFQKKQIIVSFVPVERHITARSKTDIAQTIATLFSTAILADPEQYFWVHDRFRNTEKKYINGKKI